jgi:hypothetical protein
MERALVPPPSPAAADVAAGGASLPAAAALFVTMAAAARHHPVPMAAAQARESLRALASAAAADVACAAALEGVLLVQRAPKGSRASEGGQAMQLDPSVVSAATVLSRAVGWDAWTPEGDAGGGGRGRGAALPAQSQQAGPPCAACGAEPPRAAPPFQLCAACRRVAYCCRECQVADWSEHKRECRSAVAADAAAEGKAAPAKKGGK